MSLISQVHGSYVHVRRVSILAKHIAEMLPENARVLDVGCGDGKLASLIGQMRPDVRLEGVDVLVRPGTAIPVSYFDGHKLPFDDRSFDVVMFVDVLHHTDDPNELLTESARVASQAVVIKDHTMNGFLAYPTLKFMDTVSNARYGVALPYNYWPLAKWQAAWQKLGLKPSVWIDRVGLYPWWASWVFGRGLHFVTRLNVS